MEMETVYRLVGCLGSVFGIYEAEKEARKVNDEVYNGNMEVDKFRIPNCIFLEIFNHSE